MKNRVLVFFLLFFLSFIPFFSKDSVPLVSGQQCVGSHTYVDYSCDYDSRTRRYTCETNGSMVQGCGGGTCQTFGPVFCQGGTSCSISSYGTACSVYYPPTPRPPTPRPATPRPSTSTPPNSSPPPEEPTIGYFCDTCSGTCQEGGSDSIQACQASCYIDLNSCNPCPDGNCPQPGDPNAGASSCPELEESTTSDIILPGETILWDTWEKPAGATPEERLLNESPGSVRKSYTSPGDMITVAYMFRVPEGEPHSFYVYDELDETFYFLQHDNKPPVIFSRSQEVVNRAVALGYTWIQNPTGSASNIAEAKTHEKRVYKLVDEGSPWVDEDNNIRPEVRHAPIAEGYYHIPYVSCASLIRASGHTKYFTTNPSAAQPNEDPWDCFRRQPMPYRFPQDDEEDEYTEYIMSGNYVGMEQDWPRSSWVALSGESAGEQIWPRTNLYVGSDLYKYAPALKFSMMHSTVAGVNNQANKTPGFMRQAILQIPTALLVSQDPHTFHAFVNHGNVGGRTRPASDENSSQGCKVEQDSDICDPDAGEVCNIKDTYDDRPPSCNSIRLVDNSTGRAISPGGKVKAGSTYTISAFAENESRLYNFYNSHFNDPAISGSNNPVENWTKSDGINLFEIVECGSNCIPGNNGDTKVLRTSQSSSANQSENGIHSGYFDTGENVTGKTFRVEFWARVEGNNSKTLPQILVERDRYVPPTPARNFDPVIEPADTRELRFPVSNSSTSTTPSITVTNQWQKFMGTVTYNYDTNDPSGHPQGSIATKLKVILKTPADGTRIYYDNINVIGWNQPTVYYRMASALTPTQSPSFNQCSLSTHAGPTFTNLSGGFFWADLTIPEDRTPGIYNIFAALEASPGRVFFGNPNATTNCNLNRSSWDDSIADTCKIEVEVISCNDIAPQLPVVTRVNFEETNLPNLPSNPTATRFNDFRITNNQLQIFAEGGGNDQQQAAVTAMTLFIDSYNTANPNVAEPSNAAKIIEGVPTGGGSFLFTYDLEQQYTNELSIFIQAINENACNDSGELVSGWYKRNIRLMRQRRGAVIEIPKEEYAAYNCRDTKESLAGKGQLDRVVDITDGTFTSMSLTANTSGTFGEITATYSSTFGDFKRLSYGTVNNDFITDLPYNPLNVSGWRNVISSFTLNLPTNITEESYVCLEKCNPNIGTDISPRCQAASAVDPDMVIPKPQYSPYPHIEYSNDLNIYVGKGNFNDAWWQARGGLVFSNNEVRSNLPLFNGNPRILCNDQISPDVCIPFIAARNLTTPGSGNTNSHTSSGFVITNSSSISNGSTTTPNSYRSQNPGGGSEPYSMSSNVSNTVMRAEDYGFYFEQLDEAKTNPLNVQQLPQLNGSVLDTATVYDSEDNLIVYRRSGTLEIDLRNRPIYVPADKKVVIFVDGLVDIFSGDPNDTYRINVENGGFFAIIATGNIEFDHDVGHADHTNRTPAVKGIFMSDQQIVIKTKGEDITDKKFIGEGSFIGLMGVDLQRKFDSDNPFDREKNSASPVEQFIFSPSLVAATPNFLRQTDLTWQETN